MGNTWTRTAAGVTALGLLAACGSADPGRGAPATGGSSTPGAATAQSITAVAQPDLVVAVMPVGLELGEDPRGGDAEGREEISGQLAAVEGCLVLDGGIRRIPVWPAGTTWDPQRGVVVAPGIGELALGARIEASARTSGSQSTNPAAGSHGSAAAPQANADRLIDEIAGLGPCMAEVSSSVVAYELADVAAAARPALVVGPIADHVVRVTATVLDDGDGAELCVGGVADSLPPQCGGPRITNWDWSAVEHDTAPSVGPITRWTDATVEGTFSRDGTTFMLMAEPAPPSSRGPDRQADFSTPCPEPPEGWPAATVSAPTSLPLQPAGDTGAVATIEGYGGSWWDQTTGVLNVLVVGDVAAAESAVDAAYDGAFCVVPATRTEAELRAIQDELVERGGFRAGGPIVSSGIDGRNGALQVTFSMPAPALEAQLRADYGDAVLVDHAFEIVG